MTPVERIVGWVTDKPLWWQLAIKITLQNGSLTDDNIHFLFNTSQGEYGLIPKHPKYDSFASPIDITGFTSEEHPVNLNILSDVEGVAALAEQQSLDFESNGLTIGYGDNGAGKSSYASILKHACLTRGILKPISGNVFTTNNKQPQASITVEVNGATRSISWTPESKPDKDAKSIRVFDTASAHHYLSGEDALGYKPVGLNLLTELTKAADGIKRLIEEDTMGTNGLVSIPPLPSGSPASIFLSKLSGLETEQEVNAHCATQEEIDSIEARKAELIQYKAQSPAQIKAGLLNKKQLLTPLVNFFSLPLKLLNAQEFDRLKQLELDYISKQETVDKLRLQTLSNLPFDNIGNSEWSQLWAAAKVFIQKEGKEIEFPPNTGDSCPLCLQDIGIDCASKLQEFEAFIQNSAAKDARAAYQALATAKQAVNTLNLNISQYESALNESENIKNGLKVRLEELVTLLTDRKSSFLMKELPASLEVFGLLAYTDLAGLITELDQQIGKITDDDSQAKFIAQKDAELITIQDRKYIVDHRENILSNIKRLHTVTILQLIKQECNTRSVSTLSSSIYSDGVIEPLKQSFQSELNAFGFNRFTIEVKTRNKGGHQQFKLLLSNSGESVVAKVASEGEQRCIAIASFLAEMKADARESAVIFDDPVNSLSHQWSARVADRLVRESLERQVVIFTHDIVFYKLLLEAAERMSQDKIGYISLERSRDYAGLVRTNPPWDALTTSKRIGVLNIKLQGLKSIRAKGTETEFRNATRPFYSLLREAWERLVEEKLLNKVVNRFERGIHIQRLTRLDDINQLDFDMINSAYDKCCNNFSGHDTATGMGHPYPTIDEVVADLEAIKNYLAHLQKDRKRT
ncbi:AAA family ATPase [Colwellia psychrerythraea]|uniref:Putative chromosomal cassette SCCmec type IVc protein n=1 Tax=Colwellia psychrerythraea TaxID=28229 RepID=A0A099KFU7_COLPS|nr:AAA family ATPase [Colwellia psychrerythraea]KGJ89604.1 putative chromosomal cassette SCCmec type IVc protein [Colwellia psychrerythraea]